MKCSHMWYHNGNLLQREMFQCSELVLTLRVYYFLSNWVVCLWEVNRKPVCKVCAFVCLSMLKGSAPQKCLPLDGLQRKRCKPVQQLTSASLAEERPQVWRSKVHLQACTEKKVCSTTCLRLKWPTVCVYFHPKRRRSW